MPLENKEAENIAAKDVMHCLGEITGRLDQMATSDKEYRQAADKTNGRTTIALIGVIAAQIGVKVLGTPVLLDIATALAIIGIVILMGAMIFKMRIKKFGSPLTKTGKFLLLMMGMITLTQIAVYFRDMGLLSANIIYFIRILQNITILIFAWILITDGHLYITRDKSSASDLVYKDTKDKAVKDYTKTMQDAEEVYQQTKSACRDSEDIKKGE